MGIGHVAVGLGLKRADRGINAGWLVFAALLSDFLLGIFVLLGVEQVHIPADYASRHYLMFSFPYSHGLVASVVWAAVAALLLTWVWRGSKENRSRSALIVAVAVFSHFLLDMIVHVPELPLAGPDSYLLGLGLWNHLLLELLLEVLMVAVALAVYLRCTRGATFSAKYGMTIFAALLTVIVVPTQALATKAPSPTAVAWNCISAPIILGAIVFWLDRLRTAE